MSDIEHNAGLVRRFTQALNTDELAVLDEICTPAVAEDWREGINNGQPFSDHHVEIKQIVADSENVMVVVDTHGRVAGEFYGIPPSGKPLRIEARSTSVSNRAGFPALRRTSTTYTSRSTNSAPH